MRQNVFLKVHPKPQNRITIKVTHQYKKNVKLWGGDIRGGLYEN